MTDDRTRFGRDRGLQARMLARPLGRTSESTRLRERRRRRQHIVLVADEHGTLTGLVATGEVLEELADEIEDELVTRSRFEPRAP